MKKTIITVMILTAMILLITFNFEAVQAYTGNIEIRIEMPENISLHEKEGSGTISISTTLNESSLYKISYQKIDITQATADAIKTKLNNYNNYFDASNTSEEYKTELDRLYKEALE